MALKSLLFVFMVAASAAAPMAEAQLGLGGLLGLIQVQGTLFCTANGNINLNGSTTPVFSNARVQMECGAGNVVSSATTSSAGIFSMVLDPLQFLMSSLLSGCRLVVATPLATCNAALPSAGILQSPLKFIGNTVQGFLNIANIVPSGFGFLPSV